MSVDTASPAWEDAAMDKTLTRADVILTLDDIAAGVACFGAPLQDEHGIAEVSPGVLADGSQPRDAGGRAARCGVRDARLRRGSVHRAAMVEFPRWPARLV
jgi:hypothetical protein